RRQYRLGHRLHLLDDVVLAIQRVTNAVRRLGAGSGHHIADGTARGLRRLPRRSGVRGRRSGVLLGALGQGLPVDQGVIQGAAAQALHDLNQVGIDRLVGEQTLIELALHLFRERRPVAADGLHADEFNTALAAAALTQARVTLARAALAVTGSR